METGAKAALCWWAFQKVTGGPPPEDPTAGDGDFGNTPDD
jgi:hypothetical protein